MWGSWGVSGYQGDILAQRACGLAEESAGCAVPTLGPLICFLIHPTLDGWLKEDPSVCRLVHSWWKLAQGILACHHQPCRERGGPRQELPKSRVAVGWRRSAPSPPLR